ncbi:DUF1015 domain-containing protein [Sabulilitoribacter multivorans]|uniref:DUF1015 domain-containing protein n=1 Tax=Flaviramulus multivorans TaxID=1304750 RepID=A0ABS9IHT5_9FLAO|nr:DUF1015 domain-containing protein [Flaviramulus multivorans]MCF7560205.1 DUF1015 domain-containing protein [Flaviramulus multivorans]
MAKIIPFKAVRPTRDKVSLVASRSYQSYTQSELEARLDYNPFSFLHIINPGYKYHKDIVGKERYSLVRNRYQEFKEDNIFIQDKLPSYYIYKIVNREGLSFSGIIAAASADDYKNDIIKKHEDTIEYREIIFKDYLKTVGFNAEPVLLTYPDNTVIENIILEAQKERAEFEFTTTYRDTHYMWKVDDDALVNIINLEFESMQTVYIADGHHRCASSYLLSDELKSENKNHTGKEPYNYFMTYLIPESDLKIHEFNRLIKDLNGLSKESFLIKLDAMFRIENRGTEFYKPTKKHHFSMYLDGEFYSLYLRKNNYAFNTALDALDTQVLYKTILEPILGITDLRNDTRIHYSHGKNDLVNIKEKVDDGLFQVGFGLVPITVNELKAIADEGLTMPPKSTFIEPKLRSGVTIYEF